MQRLFSLIILLFFSAALFAQKPDSLHTATADTRQHITSCYNIIMNQLVPMKPEPFPLKDGEYSAENMETARLQVLKGNLEPVHIYIQKALKDKSVRKDHNLFVAARSVWIEWLLNLDLFDSAYNEAAVLVNYADSTKPATLVLAYIAFARCAFAVDDYANANDYVERAMELAVKNKDKVNQARAQMIAGIIARKYFWGTTGRSSYYYQKAIDLALECGDSITLIRAYGLMHADNLEVKGIDQSFPFLEKAIQLTLAGKWLKGIPSVSENLSNDMDWLDKKEECHQLLLTALRYAKTAGMKITINHVYIQLGCYFMKYNRYDSAVFYFDQCKQEEFTPPGVKNIELEKAGLYLQMGDYKQAANFYRAGLDKYLDKSIMLGQSSISRWETKMRTQEKELQLQKNAELRRQLVWGIGAIGVLLLLTLWAFMRQRSLKMRMEFQNKTISHQSELLRESLTEKELLLKEIHHRVKNNLQVIESLLDMHQARIESPEQKQSFVKARTHIRSIALIHQNLYQQQSLANINMHSFANDLFKQTDQIFNATAGQSNFNNNISNINLDIDTAIPIGLILNELLTNSFKYTLHKAENIQVSVEITEEKAGEEYTLHYRDNGPGLPPGFDLKKGGSMGMKLARDLSRQVGGTLGYQFDNGSYFTIHFLSHKGRKKID